MRPLHGAACIDLAGLAKYHPSGRRHDALLFGIGHGVPIIPIATFSRAVGGRIGEKYLSIGGWTTKFFGLLVIVVGMVYAARYAGFLLW